MSAHSDTWSEKDRQAIRGAMGYIANVSSMPHHLQKGIKRWQERIEIFDMLTDPPCSVAAAEYILSLYVAALLRAEE